MAAMTNDDLKMILGPDFEMKMKNVQEMAEPTTAVEKAASAKRAGDKLADFQLTLSGFVLVGSVFVIGSLYEQQGLSIQALAGALLAVAGLAGIAVTAKKRSQLSRQQTYCAALP